MKPKPRINVSIPTTKITTSHKLIKHLFWTSKSSKKTNKKKKRKMVAIVARATGSQGSAATQQAGRTQVLQAVPSRNTP